MSQKEQLISIIVPVYNCEDYIEKCLNSICNQTYRNIEIILVDDGSLDNSGCICDEYALADKRITVVHKKNGGQQDTRTVGIKLAKGTYLGFVDSDDWIELDMYEKLVNMIDNCDLVTSGIHRYGPEGNIIDEWTDLLPVGEYSFDDEYFVNNLIISEKYEGGAVVGGISNNLVSKLFRTELAKKIADIANVHMIDGEDFLFALLYILQTKKIKITHDIFYHYRCNPHSVVNALNLNYLVERTVCYNTIMRELDVHIAGGELKRQFQRRFLLEIYAGTGNKFGIDIANQYPAFRFPNEAIIQQKRVVIFGAGHVGISYISFWKREGVCDIVAWVDNNPGARTFMGLNARYPELIKGIEFDLIICAILNENRANAMREQLVSMGVDISKIIWEQPINIWYDFLRK